MTCAREKLLAMLEEMQAIKYGLDGEPASAQRPQLSFETLGELIALQETETTTATATGYAKPIDIWQFERQSLPTELEARLSRTSYFQPATA